jgi:hypothetical protein
MLRFKDAFAKADELRLRGHPEVWIEDSDGNPVGEKDHG